MKKFQRWMGILLVAIAASSLVVACGDDSESSCITDSDCATGDLCNFATETCAIACTDDATACLDDEACVPRGADNEGSICVVTDVQPECSVDDDCDTAAGETCNVDTGVCEGGTVGECSTNEDCDVDGGEFCDTTTNTCESTAVDTYFFAELVDASSGDDACDAPDPGSDIFAIELSKADGSGPYQAFAINGDIKGGDDNEQTDYLTVLDGTAPSLTGTCTEFDDTFSLGCGGNVSFYFVDENDTRVEIENGDTITPFEYGETCGGDALDSWTVNICSADVTENDLAGSTTACAGTSAGSGSGISGVAITL